MTGSRCIEMGLPFTLHRNRHCPPHSPFSHTKCIARIWSGVHQCAETWRFQGTGKRVLSRKSRSVACMRAPSLTESSPTMMSSASVAGMDGSATSFSTKRAGQQISCPTTRSLVFGDRNIPRQVIVDIHQFAQSMGVR